MARNMAEAWREVPHISLFDEIDAQPVLDALRAARELSGDDSLTLTAFFVRAAVLVLDEEPDPQREPRRRTRRDRVPRGVPHGRGGRVASTGSWSRSCTTRRRGRCGSSGARSPGSPPRRAPVASLPTRSAAPRSRSPTTAPKAGASPRRSCGRRKSASSGAARSACAPWSRGDTVVAAPTLPLSLSADHRVVDGRERDRVPRRRCSPSRRPARAPRRTRLTGFRAAAEATGVGRGGR